MLWNMLYPLKPGCFKPRKDGTSIIHIQYCYSSDYRTLLDTGIRIPVKNWDKKRQIVIPDLPAEYGNTKKVNEALTGQLRLIESMIDFAIKRSVPDIGVFVKNHYKPDLDIYSFDAFLKKAEQDQAEKETREKRLN